jgi:elongator complex protein 6
MSSRTRRSLVLESYLQTPDETASLYLLTSTLGCSVNWLISQFIGVALDETGNLAQQDGTVGETHQASAVVLVSWLRDLAFWNHELRRATVRFL